jgi:hypothetical protein
LSKIGFRPFSRKLSDGGGCPRIDSFVVKKDTFLIKKFLESDYVVRCSTVDGEKKHQRKYLTHPLYQQRKVFSP